ncbi:sigma 54-interacting transcriptional regulator [candidate division KSB1 bacterium]|nr:sigma 54-interacting transcriptional regulator [candidate division KSB1 bacterium]
MSFRVYYILRPAPFQAEKYAEASLARLREQLGVDELLCVLGPRYLELFLAETTTAKSANGIYADESRLFLSFLSEECGSALAKITTCEHEAEAHAIAHYFRSALGWLPEGARDEQHAKAFRVAHEAAHARAHLGVQLNRLYERALWFTEKVRLETDFFSHTVSLATTLLEVAGKIFGGFKNRTALILGNNMEAARTAQALREADIGGLLLFNKVSQAEDYLNSVLLETVNENTFAPLADLILIFDALHPQFGDPRFIQKLMAKRQRAPLLLADFTDHTARAAEFQKMYNLFFFARSDLNRLVDQKTPAREQVENKITQWLASEVESFRQWLASAERFHFGRMVGSSAQMQAVFEMIARIARTDITVLIQGESGTGKELVAAAVHESSGRVRRPFVVVNCGAIPESLLESELFGHVRGAFTGAISNKKGLFEEAHMGTIFLDEIGELPQQLQVKLLRFLQDNVIRKVGSNVNMQLDVRVLAATNRDLEEMVAQGKFRSDLYYRLNVIRLDLPPLRERRDDIPVLARHFLLKYAAFMRKPARELSREALQKIMSYSWPGNVRELENAMERAVALSLEPEIGLAELPESLRRVAKISATNHVRPSLKEMEQRYILETVEHCGNNYDEAARVLGIGRTTLWRKLKEYQGQE